MQAKLTLTEEGHIVVEVTDDAGALYEGAFLASQLAVGPRPASIELDLTADG